MGVCTPPAVPPVLESPLPPWRLTPVSSNEDEAESDATEGGMETACNSPRPAAMGVEEEDEEGEARTLFPSGECPDGPPPLPPPPPLVPMAGEGEVPAGAVEEAESEDGGRPTIPLLRLSPSRIPAADSGAWRKGSEEEAFEKKDPPPPPPPPPPGETDDVDDTRLAHSVSRMAVMRESSIPAPRMTATRSEASAMSSNVMPFNSRAARK